MGKYDDARAEREFRMNPPSNSPGQGSDDSWGDIYEGSSSVDDSSNALLGQNQDINSMLNPSNTMNNGVNVQSQMPAKPSTEEFIVDAIINVSKALYNFMKLLVTSFSNNTDEDWRKLGFTCLCSAGITFSAGLFFCIIKVFVKNIYYPSDLIVASAFLFIASVSLMLVKPKKDTENTLNNECFPEPEEPLDESPIEDFNFDDFNDEDSFENMSFEDDTDGEDVWGSLLDGGDDLFSENSENLNKPIDVEEAINSIEKIPAGTQTRQYLYETFTKVLPLLKPNYGELIPISSGSDEFFEFEDYLRSAAEQVGTPEEKIPELQEVKKNLFIIQLVATRPVGLKEQEIADYVADSYKRDESGLIPEENQGIYATLDSRVGALVINIFLCSNVMFSLGDVYRNIKDFILDPKINMPLVWGVNEFGQPLYYDGIKDGNGGILISGEGRSGKSYKGQSLIAQMSMFLSPKEVNFYFFDVKGTKSDYYYLSSVIPHAKGFCSDALKFNSELTKIIDRELKYSDKLLGEANCINIKDYNKQNPTKKLPYIYFVVDEMAAAMVAMSSKDKELRSEFDKILLTVVTKYPYFGFRLMLFPHRITNDIINKTVSSQISCRAIMGLLNFDELKNALNVTKKDFPYNLVKPGDTALRTKDIANGSASYCHAEVLTPSDSENRKIFDYIGAIWANLEPDCKSGCVNSYTTSNKTAKDNTVGQESYDYKGYNNTGTVADVLEDMGEDTHEEDFWDDLIKDYNN